MISDLILIAKKFSVPSAYGRRDGVRDFFAQYPDGVYIATDAGAPAGWEGYAVWFGGTGERYAERFMEFIRDGYIVERFLRARVGGLLVFTFRCRLKMRRFGTLGKPNGSEPGPSPIDEWWGLKLTMPEGGTVILRKTGSPNAVNLEVSTDAVNWEAWELVGTYYSYTLQAGETLCIRNTSETPVALSTSDSDYWSFGFISRAYAVGEITSLLCRENTPISLASFPYCFYGLFIQTAIITMPSLSNISAMGIRCFQSAFGACSYLEETTSIPNATQTNNVFRNCFSNCTSLKKVILEADVITGMDYLGNWLLGVSPTGDFYCPAELTIPTGNSGIPSGWTRHDI